MSAEQKQISLQIFTATPDSDNDETRRFVPDGDNCIMKNHRGGYFTHAYVCSRDLDMSGVMSGRGKGFISFQIENGEDEVARELIEEWRQGRIEVIFMYREYKQEEGIWENKKTVCVWGYIASANLQKGASSLAAEAHVVRVINQNDAIGTRDYSIDCITGASTIRGGDLGTRQPEPLDPVDTPDSSDWGALLNG